MSYGMTQRMSDCLAFIELRWARDGIAPSMDEIKTHLGLKSKSGVHRLIVSLEERGLICRLIGRARALFPTRQKQISILLPDEVDQRLRVVAGLTEQTAEGYVTKLIMDKLATHANRTGRAA